VRGSGIARLEVIAGIRRWAWPLLSALIGLVAVTALAAVHRQIDLAHLPVRLVQILFTWASLGALVVVLATSLRVTCPNFQRRTVAWWSLLLLVYVPLASISAKRPRVDARRMIRTVCP
jgi:hypothetical protein